MEKEKLSFPNEIMLTIDQISHLTAVRKSSLRYWEKAFGDFLKPSRTQTNRREYTIEDLNRVKLIKHLLHKEHLTSYGAHLRLQELLATEGKDEEPQAKSKIVESKIAEECAASANINNPSFK